MNKVSHKDIMTYEEFPNYDILWTDPPWNDRMTKWFQTKLLKETGVVDQTKSIDLIIKLCTLASTEKPLIIEYDIKGYETVLDVAAWRGHQLFSVNHRIMTSGNPYVILVFNKDIEISMSKGASLITETLSQLEEKVIFDPFAGIGFTATAVFKANKNYIGSEMNEKRFNKLLSIVNKQNAKR